MSGMPAVAHWPCSASPSRCAPERGPAATHARQPKRVHCPGPARNQRNTWKRFGASLAANPPPLQAQRDIPTQGGGAQGVESGASVGATIQPRSNGVPPTDSERPTDWCRDTEDAGLGCEGRVRRFSVGRSESLGEVRSLAGLADRLRLTPMRSAGRPRILDLRHKRGQT